MLFFFMGVLHGWDQDGAMGEMMSISAENASMGVFSANI